MKTSLLPLLLLSVVVLCGASSSFKPLGSSKCSWGPGYWCADLAKARECAATSHCIENYWSQLELPPDDDEVCAICKQMVAEARDTLRSNETREELKEVFEGSCKLIPIKAIANECIQIFDDFVPELVEALASEMNPQIVCATAGLCNSERIDRLLKNLYAKGSSSMCQTCRSGIQRLVTHIRDSNPESIKLRLMDMCGELSSYSDACKVTVSESFADMHNVLKNNLNDEVCDLMGVCSETFQTEVIVPNRSEDLECEFCEKVIKHWKDEWTSRTTIEEFKEVLDALCNKLHDTDRVNRCLHIVDDYYIPMFNFLAHELNPKVVCQMFGLCNSNLEAFLKVSDDSSVFTLLFPEGKGDSLFTAKVPLFDAQNTVELTPTFESQTLEDEDYPYVPMQEAERVVAQTPLISLFPSRDNSEQQIKVFEASSLYESDDGVPLVKLQSSVVIEQTPTSPAEESNLILGSSEGIIPDSDLGCQLCKDVIIALKSRINNKTEEEIKEKLEKMCLAFPPSVRDQCKAFVDKYTDQIINGIINDMSPEELCEQLQLCKPTIIIIQEPSVDNTAGCALCEYIIGELDIYLNKKGNRDSIEKALQSVCDMMSSPVSKKKCEEFVDTYINMILDTFTHGMTPKELCQLIYICQSGVAEPRNDLSFGLGNQCKICDGIFTEIYEDVLDKEEEIKEALRNVCYAVLSGSDVDSCKTMVDTYVSMVISNVMDHDSPEAFCRNFYQCNEEEQQVEEMKPLLHPNEIPPLEMVLSNEYSMGSFCQDCMKVINEMENSAFTNTSIDFTVRALQMVCSTFPSPVDSRCEEAIDEIDEDIEGFFANNPPKSVCKYLRLCPSSLYDPRSKLWDAGVVGGSKCVWGPEYWCQSLIHARSCGTIDHCKNNAWL